MKKAIIATLYLFLLVSCGPKATPPVAIPVAPPKTESVKPYIEKTQGQIDKGVEENIKINEKTKQQTESLSEQKITIEEALLKSESIKSYLDLNNLKSDEVDNLIALLKKIEDKNKVLIGKNKELFLNIETQNKILIEAKKSAANSMFKLAQKEEETDFLRLQRDSLAENLSIKNDEVMSLQSKVSGIEKKLAAASVYKKWVFGLAAVLILFSVSVAYLKVIKPF